MEIASSRILDLFVLTVVHTTYILVRICNPINNIFTQLARTENRQFALSFLILKIIDYTSGSGGSVVAYRRCDVMWGHGSKPVVD
jgi:hypothetical protein